VLITSGRDHSRPFHGRLIEKDGELYRLHETDQLMDFSVVVGYSIAHVIEVITRIPSERKFRTSSPTNINLEKSIASRMDMGFDLPKEYAAAEALGRENQIR
jgi:hypothetical protein